MAFRLNMYDLVVLRAYDEGGCPYMNGFAMVTAKGLAEKYGVSRPKIADTLEKLAALGFLEPAPTDKAGNVVPRRITPAGVEARDEARALLFGDLL